MGVGSTSRDRSARTGRARHVLLALAATVLALAGTFAPARVPAARAAGGGLQLSTAATYTIAPARHVVRVTVAVTARNDKPNVTSGGIVTKYFYDGARIAIQTEAKNIQASSSGVRVTTTTKAADGYLVLEVRFRSSLFYHQATRVDVSFDLPGGAPRSKSDIRVGSAFATFVAWAFGDTASVRIVVPAGFDAEATGSDAAKSSSGGATVFRATGITDVGAWYLVVNADRETALTRERIDLSGGEHIVIRAWPEDAKWKASVSDLLTRGLPGLVERTGLAWPVGGDLSIFEVHTPLLEGYAGVFLQGEDKIEISEDLDDLTILHEASHAWFNSDLFEGRWIDEGLADTYAARTLDSIGSGGWAPDNVSPTDRAAVRLNGWTFPGRITDDATDARERYGYDAAWTVVRSLVDDVGFDPMKQVLSAAQTHQIAYIGAGFPETVSGVNDWRRLLDLLDEAGHARTADEVFRRWVVTDAEAELLDRRADARTAYAALVQAGGDWQAPFYVRGPLSDWDFAAATPRMAEAIALLARRDEIASIAAPLGVTPPADLRTSYQAARVSLEDANRVADGETAAVRALATATEAVAAPRAPLVALGLLGTTPETDLASARSAFSAGIADAATRATAVTALIDGAVAIGRGRLVAAVIGLVVALILLVVAIVLLRRLRRNRASMAPLGATSGAPGGELTVMDGAAVPVADGEGPAVGRTDGSGEPDPEQAPAPEPDQAGGPSYATLADQSSRASDADPATPGPAPADPPDATDATDPTKRRSRRSRRARTDPPDPTDSTMPPPADRGDAS